MALGLAALSACAGKKPKTDEEQVEQFIRKQSRALQKCYKVSTSAKAKRSGEFDFELKFLATGVLDDIRVFRSDLKDPALESCVIEVIREIDFPPPLKGGKFQMNYPIKFVSAKD